MPTVKEIYKKEFPGMVVEYNGRYWGTQWEDAQCSCREFGPIENADIVGFGCSKPTDLTHNPANTLGINPDYEELKKGRFVKVTKTVIFELEDS